MKVKDLFEDTRHYVGSCVDSFDEDGECLIGNLPWSTVSDLALADEEAVDIGRDNFIRNVLIPSSIENKIKNHKAHYLEHDKVFMLYDEDTDIHYFFI